MQQIINVQSLNQSCLYAYINATYKLMTIYDKTFLSVLLD